MAEQYFRKDFRLVLGSKSPRRRELIARLGFPYRITSIQCDEVYPDTLQAEEVPEYLAKLKASQFSNYSHNEILITADTVVIHNEEILGKPANHEKAKEYLVKLSNDWHKVITGVCMESSNHWKNNKNQESFRSVTNVKFKSLSTAEIDYYLNNFQVLDKAGAYGIQDWIGRIGVEEIKGDFYNVMGLPVGDLFQKLIGL